MKISYKSWDKGRESIKDFLHKASHEIHETKEAGIILKKYSHGHSLSKDEKRLIKQQVFDVLKSVGIGIPFFLIPGASILLPILISIAKKHNINLLPSSFE